MNKINEKDITVIIEGPIEKNISNKVINNFLKRFLKSNIIISTHIDQKLYKKFYLKKNITIIKNNYPNIGYYRDKPKSPHSANLYIQTCGSALKIVTTKYCLKARYDMFFKNKNFLKFFDKFNLFDDKAKFVKKRILVSSHYTINPHKLPLPFHISDWFFFGLTEDLKKLFYIKKSSEPTQSRWFEKKKKPFKINLDYYCRYRPEQYLWKSFITKFIKINFQNSYHASYKNIYFSDKIVANNTVIIQPDLAGFISLKHKNFDNRRDLYLFDFNYNFYDWLKLYKKYCNLNFDLSGFKNNKSIIRTFKFIIFNPIQALSIMKLILRSKIYIYYLNINKILF